MFRKSLLYVVLILTVVSLVTVGCGEKKVAGEIKIGAVLPLTGDAAVYGQAMKNAIDLAVADANKETVGGKTIKVVYEDDQGAPTQAVNSLQKLVSFDKVDIVIGGAMSSLAAAMIPVADKNKVLLIAPSASSPALSSKSIYFFRVWPSDVFEAGEIAKFTYNILKLKTVSCVYVNNDYGKGASEVFKTDFIKLGGTIKVNEGYEPGSTDFKSVISKVKNSKSEGVYIPGYQKELIGLLRQSKEMGLKTQFIGGVGFKDPAIIAAVKDAAENVVFTTPYYDPEGNDSVTKKFVSDFNTKYKAVPDIYSAHSYDTARVLIATFIKGAVSGDSVRKELLALKAFPGVTGSIQFDANGDVIKPMQIFIVRNGKFVPYAK